MPGWDGTRWNLVRLEAGNLDKYLVALPDIARGTPQVIAERVMTETLLANDVLANSIFARYITAKNLIRSEATDAQGNPLFLLDGITGMFTAMNAVINGVINASGGNFQNVLIGDRAIFEGSIHSGPLYASNAPTTPSPARTWPVGTNIRTIQSNLGIPANETRTVNVSGGSFGSTAGLISLEFVSQSFWAPMAQTMRWFLTLRIVFPNNTITVAETVSQGNLVNSASINQALTIGGTGTGQTFRLFNLPTGGEGLPAGTVWRDSSGILRVV